MADEKERAEVSAALLGVPTGDETLSRTEVDGLEVSTRRQKLPEGMSRAEYRHSRPGTETGTHIIDAGLLSPGRRIAIVIAVSALFAAAGAAVWYLVLQS